MVASGGDSVNNTANPGVEHLHFLLDPDEMRRVRLVAAGRRQRISHMLRPLVMDFVDREYERLGLGDPAMSPAVAERRTAARERRQATPGTAAAAQ
jgi:hypothetical protein